MQQGVSVAAQGSAPPSMIASISLSLMTWRAGPGGPREGTGGPRRMGMDPPTIGTAIMFLYCSGMGAAADGPALLLLPPPAAASMLASICFASDAGSMLIGLPSGVRRGGKAIDGARWAGSAASAAAAAGAAGAGAAAAAAGALVRLPLCCFDSFFASAGGAEASADFAAGAGLEAVPFAESLMLATT